MTRAWTIGIAAVALTLVTAGCGGDDGDGDGGGDGGADFTAQSAEKIAEAAKKAMGDLEGVTIDGTLSTEGQEIGIDMSIGTGGNCTGSFTIQGASAEVLGVDGTTWIRPDEAYWETSVGPDGAAQIIEAVGDRWVTLPDDDTSFKPFCDLEEFLGELTDQADATYTKGETRKIDGDETIEIISDRPDEGVSSGYIQVEGEHYLVLVEKTEGDEPGSVSFSGFDEQPEVEAPADDEQIPLEELQASVS
jgi:hypothetical protein